MQFKYNWFLSFLTLSIFCGCTGKSFGMLENTEPMHINRFDSALYQWIDSDNPVQLEKIKQEYPHMLDVLEKAIFQTRRPAFFNDLINYFSEPTLKKLYREAITFYAGDDAKTIHIAKEFAYGFAQMKKQFPTMQLPAVYMHVSGFQQNMIVADSLLSCSIDKYMGADYPLYADFFYDYQRKNMVPERVAKDGLSVWLQTEYPFQGKDNVLLERMIYEGKICYVLTQIGNKYTFRDLFSLSETEYKWCLEYESTLWTTIIERQHLYTPDIAVTSKYFQPAPSRFISEEAPGNLGHFIGYRIVERYMKQTKATCETLMNNNDAQDILQKSKYKP